LKIPSKKQLNCLKRMGGPNSPFSQVTGRKKNGSGRVKRVRSSHFCSKRGVPKLQKKKGKWGPHMTTSHTGRGGIMKGKFFSHANFSASQSLFPIPAHTGKKRRGRQEKGEPTHPPTPGEKEGKKKKVDPWAGDRAGEGERRTLQRRKETPGPQGRCGGKKGFERKKPPFPFYPKGGEKTWLQKGTGARR